MHIEDQEKTILILKSLIDNADMYYFHNSKSEEYIYFYPKDLSCIIKITNPSVNGLEWSIEYEEKFDTVRQKYCFFLNDWTIVKPLLDKIINEMEFEKNKGELFNTPYTYANYFELFKKGLRNQTIPEGYSINKLGIKDNLKLEVIEKNTNLKHYLNIGTSLTNDNDNDNNKINTLVGCIGLVAVIDTGIIDPFYNKSTRVLTLIIPGYELSNYPILTEYIKLPIIHQNINDWIRDAVDSQPDALLKNKLSYFILSNKLEEKEIDKKNRYKI